jgi:hypothetical protein
MVWPRARQPIAVALAAFQAADLVVTSVSKRYGDDHLQHLGVPKSLRPFLPAIKLTAVLGLMGSARRPGLRSAVGLLLVPYYTAATTFHVLSGDRPQDMAPAAACALMAAALV